MATPHLLRNPPDPPRTLTELQIEPEVPIDEVARKIVSGQWDPHGTPIWKTNQMMMEAL